MQTTIASSQTPMDQAQYPALAMFIESLGYLPGCRYPPGNKPEQERPSDDGDYCNGDY